MQAYFWALADEPAEPIQKAVRRWLRTEKWFPKPSELIALADEITDDDIRSGHRALPVATAQSASERLATLRRIVAKAESFNITLHPNIAKSIAELERGAA